MNGNINEVKQNEVELVSVSESEPLKIKKFQMIIRKINLKTTIIIAVVIVVGAPAYIYKGSFIVATVNGNPISRLAVIGKLEKASGKKTLDSLITQKLIADELDKKKITVTDDEINADIKNIEDQIAAQGSTLAQALTAQGMTTADLKDQVSINLRMEKLLADKTQVSDDEISQYIKDNKLTVPKGQEARYNDQIRNQLKSNKINQAAKDWVSSIRSQASIRYFVNY